MGFFFHFKTNVANAWTRNCFGHHTKCNLKFGNLFQLYYVQSTIINYYNVLCAYDNWKVSNKIWKGIKNSVKICINFLIVPGLQWQLNLFVLLESLSYLSNKEASVFKGLQINPFQCLFTQSIHKSKDTYIIFSNQQIQIHVQSDQSHLGWYTIHRSCNT